MKTKRSLLVLVLAMVLSFMLAACSNTPTGSSSTGGNTESLASTPGTAAGDVSTTLSDETESTAAGNSRILIAHFSYTGNTEEVAQKIAEYTGGDLAEIQRAEEYENLQQEAEILDGVHPDITVPVESIADYDTIFVGYPIW